MMLTWTRSGEAVYHRVLAPHKKLLRMSTTIMKYGWYRTVDIRVMWLQRVHKNIKEAVCLTDLIKENPHMPAQVYTARPEGELGPGLPNFHRYGLLLPAHASSHCDGNGFNILAHHCTYTLHLLISLIGAERVVSAVSIPYVQRTYCTPINNIGDASIEPLTVIHHVLPATLSDNSLVTTPWSRQNMYEQVTIMPVLFGQGDHNVSDTSCLWELPDARMVAVYNHHIPPLHSAEFDNTLASLQSHEGVEPEPFWQAFDMCNCNCLFTKEALHFMHGPKFPLWIYNDVPPA
ncbi:hypothetical protein JB92DRAFT_2826779 [Gautieria morchelliformis]|nr:hypothetical protein JB92DRAFT_2826779 [Gautieria morchelliformis]